MISDTDIAFIAGLFDGEGCITYKQYMRKRKHQKKAYPTWSIRMEMAMTDESVLRWVHEVLGVGTVGEKRYKTKYTVGWKNIDHYGEHKVMNGNIINLEEYKQTMSLE
jgi:hypothetical protein